MADAAELEAAATVLLTRADDLSYLGEEIVRRSAQTRWECAKAERFHDAMLARRAECRRLAVELRDLGRSMRAQAQVVAATGQPGA
jgi:uncharacterized protein YukE